AAAHRRGVLHRDIKPANAVASEEGPVKLLDFGLAELLPEAPSPEPGPASERIVRPPPADAAATRPLDPDSASARTEDHAAGPRERPARIVGTPLYMAPEIWQGHPATTASDVYSLGVLLFELCTGRPPSVASMGLGRELPEGGASSSSIFLVPARGSAGG